MKTNIYTSIKNAYINKIKNNKGIVPYLFLIPAISFIVIFLLYPLSTVFYYSFQNYNMNKPYLNGFAGLQNYINILTDDAIFYRALLTSFKWVVVQVVLQLIIGLITALVLNQQFRGRGFIRAMVFAPWAISGVIVAVMWSLMFNEHVGVLNDLLIKLSITDNNIAWLANSKFVFPSLVVAELWRGIPFFAIMLLAALQTIPEEVYESCHMDGANRFDVFRNITIPFLKETIILSTLLRAVWEFKTVDIIMSLTGGGPNRQTTTLSMYLIEQAIKTNNFGYGSAIAVITFLILTIFASLYLTLSRFGEES